MITKAKEKIQRMPAGHSSLRVKSVANVSIRLRKPSWWLSVPPAIIGVEVTATLWWCPPVVRVGFGIAAWKKQKERAKWNNKIEYHNAMEASIGVALGLPQDSQEFLQWVYGTNISGPNAVDFVDVEARQKWRKSIASTRAATGDEATAGEMSTQSMRTYLPTQRDTLVMLQLSTKEADKKLKT
ncbi:hypothetical protein MMC34_002198 [Xylographa carneopallida]|nr:hypothetical protein [Xylographa carneopallida]